MASRLDKDDVGRLFEYGIFIPTKTLFFSDDWGIDSENSNEFIKGLHVLDHQSPEIPITIEMNSVGGGIYDGLAIYDAIKSCQSEVHIKVVGSAFSMAAWIFQAADKRFMYPHSRLMIHVGSVGMSDHAENVKRWMKQYEKDEIIFEDILLNRIKEKKPKFTRKKLQEMLKFDTILTPKQAIEIGLADEEVETTNP